MKVVDLGSNDDQFLEVLRRHAKEESMTFRADHASLSATRALPDLALVLTTPAMSRLAAYASRFDQTVDMQHVVRLREKGIELSAENLQRGALGASEGLGALGLALVVPDDYWELDLLAGVSGIRPRLRVVAYCPEMIRIKASELSKGLSWIPPKLSIRTLQRFVIIHELGHFFIDESLQMRDTRIHDAFASYVAYSGLRDQFSRDVAQAFSVLNQGTQYNYYLLLNYYPETYEIFAKLLARRFDDARSQFYDQIAPQPFVETANHTVIVTGDVGGWPGFGAVEVSIACAGTIAGIANVRSGVVVASEVGTLDGFLPDSVRVFTNAVRRVSSAAQRSGALILLPANEVDIHNLVRPGIRFQDLVEVCAGRRRPEELKVSRLGWPYHVCLPCLCGVYIVTTETVDIPENLDVNLPRTFICDRCDTHLVHKGPGVVFFRLDEENRPDWYSMSGNVEMEKRRKATEKWLAEAQPKQVFERLTRLAIRYNKLR